MPHPMHLLGSTTLRPECTHMVPAEDKFKEIIPYAAKRQVKIIKKQLAKK